MSTGFSVQVYSTFGVIICNTFSNFNLTQQLFRLLQFLQLLNLFLPNTFLLSVHWFLSMNFSKFGVIISNSVTSYEYPYCITEVAYQKYLYGFCCSYLTLRSLQFTFYFPTSMFLLFLVLDIDCYFDFSLCWCLFWGDKTVHLFIPFDRDAFPSCHQS